MEVEFDRVGGRLHAGKSRTEVLHTGKAACRYFYVNNIALHEGSYDLASALPREALELTTRLRERVLRTAYISKSLGVVALEQGNQAQAWAFLDQALQIAAEFGDRTTAGGAS